MFMAVPTLRENANGLDRRIPARGGASRIRCFNGLSRRTSDWDGLRKDSQLWSNDADCLIYLYAYRASQRGPSLKVPYEAVAALDCGHLTNHCLRARSKLSPIPSEDGLSDSGYGSELDRIDYELYIPAPAHLTKGQAFDYHLTTRNFFAYAVGKSLVGQRLSDALVSLRARLNEWLPNRCVPSVFMTYMENQGYLEFTDNPEHALACLKFAEVARLKDLWIDAFVHCVGMHERLYLSPEWQGLSNTTVALITRASLEMDLHIARVGRAIGAFLEEELGTENLGLSKPAREHLDRFRSFLHAFYVEKLGYFPPRNNAPWDKELWTGVHQDFQMLHDLLVDVESTPNKSNGKGFTGGVCVLQNVQAFDQRHGYTPLPHPLPLLPEALPKLKRSISSQRGLRNLRLGMMQSSQEAKFGPRYALETASNRQDREVMDCSLVQEYQSFERQKLEEKLDLTEARKVRWILIYGVLQMLNSIMRAPAEVRDAESATYPLCVLTTGAPLWKTDPVLEEQAPKVDVLVPEKYIDSVAMDALEGRKSTESRSSRISIHPDCEADNAEQYFASTGLSRQASLMDLDMTPSPLRVTGSLSRRASLRESVHFSVNALHKSVVGSLSRRGSTRRNSLVPEPRKMPSFCEIVVEQYGNGLDAEEIEKAGFEFTAEPETITLGDPTPTNPLDEFDFDLAARNGEPTLEHHQLDSTAAAFGVENPDVAKYEGFTYADEPTSSGSSYNGDSPATELSSWDGDGWRRGSTGSASSVPTDTELWTKMGAVEPKTFIPSQPSVGDKSSQVCVSAGCYTPTGMLEMPVSKYASVFKRTASSESAMSGASSEYPDESVQADEIEEEELRGRRRSRGLDRLTRFVLSLEEESNR